MKNVVDKNGRVVVYDYLRLFATILVVIGHSAYLHIETQFGGVDYTLPTDISRTYNFIFLVFMRDGLSGWVYGFHMPLFFMLSGAVLALKPILGFDNVVKGKIKRLLIPYYLCGCFFMLPLKRLGNFYTNDTLPLAYNSFLGGGESGHLWFLPALFWCILCFVLLIKLKRKFKFESTWILLGFAGTIHLTYTFLPFDILGLKTGLSYILYFAIGYIFECERKKDRSIRQIIIWTMIVIIIECMNVRWYFLNSFWTIIVGCYFIWLLSQICTYFFPNALETGIGKIIMDNLFNVYLFHDPLEYIVLRLSWHFDILNNTVGVFVYSLGRTIFVFLCSIVIGVILNKMIKFAQELIGRSSI